MSGSSSASGSRPDLSESAYDARDRAGRIWAMPGRRRRIGEILVSDGVLSEQDLEDALAGQAMSETGARLGTIVIEMGLATEEQVATALARQLSLETIDLMEQMPDSSVAAHVPRELAFRHMTVPVGRENGVLVVATSDPTNVLARDDLRTVAGVDQVRMVVATETAVREALRQTYGAFKDGLDKLLEDERTVEDIDAADPEELDEPVTGANGQPVVRLANLILAEAVHSRASDIHVEPGRTNVRIRYRVDGMLREVMRIPRDTATTLVARLKIMARMDIAERRRPQDGRTVVRVEGQEVDLRISTVPALYGEKVVLRVLRKGAERISLADTGLEEDHLSQLRWSLGRPQGLVVITGPTGSGKTTTLYAGLGEIADPQRNIMTLEDPVEYQLEGINQIQVNEKVGLTFARGLKTLLRQDPDVILVGEIRDGETAQLAIQASETGHLVLSTLHTNDAPSTVIRLINLGVAPFQVAAALQRVVAQRLARKNCARCAVPYVPDDQILSVLGIDRASLDGAELLRGEGCQVCGGTGFFGRLGIFEILPVTPAIRDAIIDRTTESNLAHVARSEGMRTLREDGIRKALSGRTTLEEIVRISPSEEVVPRVCPQCQLRVSAEYVSCPFCAADLAAGDAPGGDGSQRPLTAVPGTDT